MMTVYHIIHGMPDDKGRLERYAILCSYSTEDAAMQHINEFGKCKDVERIAAGVYHHKPSGEYIEMLMSFVLE